MAIQSWQNIIDTIRNGEPVTAEVTNRAVYQLAQRTEHLKTRQDAQDYAQALFLTGAPFTITVATGNVVYFDTVSNKFAPAYSELVYKDGYLSLSAASCVVGIVVYKDTTDSGTILVEGLVDPTQYTGIDCTGDDMTANLLLDQGARGLLYLATGFANAGKVSLKPGLLNVPVCNLMDSQHLLVRPPIATPLDTQALKFSLAARPATAELVLQRMANSATDNWPIGTLTALPVGTKVRLVSSPVATPDYPTYLNLYLTGTVHSIATNTIQLKDVVVSKHAAQLLHAKVGNYAEVFKALDRDVGLYLKRTDSDTAYLLNTSNGTEETSYISVINNAGSNNNGYLIKTEYVTPALPGWLPATAQFFPDTAIPTGARYGYNFDQDSQLHQLFPETVVGTYVVCKDGVALPNSTVVTNSNGLWWFDDKLQLPWHTVGVLSILPDTNVVLPEWTLAEAPDAVRPTDLTLVYTKLVSGGINVVTTLESPADSPITVVDPYGNPANSGPLVLKAGFSVTSDSITESGSLVVKDVTGFKMKRGQVVERLTAGANISLVSTMAGGQGSVQVGVVGLDGKLEGEPDILAIDDIFVERDPILNIFYSTMPTGKSSSILGKISVPQYLQGPYTLQLVIHFIALHGAGTANLPALELSYTKITSVVGNTSNLSTATTGNPGINMLSDGVAPRDSFVVQTDLASVTAGDAVFFKLSRPIGGPYVGRVGILSIRYKLTA